MHLENAILCQDQQSPPPSPPPPSPSWLRIYRITSLTQTISLITKHITPHTNGEPLLKRSSSFPYSSPVLQQFCLSGLPTATVVKVNLLNDDIYQWNCATVIVSSFGQIEQGVDYILLNEESVSGVHSGRASL